MVVSLLIVPAERHAADAITLSYTNQLGKSGSGGNSDTTTPSKSLTLLIALSGVDQRGSFSGSPFRISVPLKDLGLSLSPSRFHSCTSDMICRI